MSGPFRTIEEKTGIPLLTWLPGRRDDTYRDNYDKIVWSTEKKVDKKEKEN
jgi:hypothetical protein